MLRTAFIIFNLIVFAIAISVTTLWPKVMWSLIVIIPGVMLSVYDSLQSH